MRQREVRLIGHAHRMHRLARRILGVVYQQGEGKAAITGGFVLIGGEVNPVIQALRQNGIAVTAVHSHKLNEKPSLFFIHFWANDDALKLARGLRTALDKTNRSEQKHRSHLREASKFSDKSATAADKL